MNEKISELISELFKEIPYSEKVETAKNRIADDLNEKYEKALENRNEIQAIGLIMSEYGTVESAAKSAGYSDTEILEWTTVENKADRNLIRKVFRRVRINLWLAAAFFIYGMSNFASFATWRSPYYLLFVGMAVGIGLVFLHLAQKSMKKINLQNMSYLSDAYRYLQAVSDRYAKRLINSMALVFAIVAFLIFTAGDLHMKLAEAKQNLFAHLPLFGIALFWFCKNLLCRLFVGRALLKKVTQTYSRQMLRLAVASTVYWGVLLILLGFFRKSSNYLTNWFFTAIAVYFILLLIYNLTVRKRIVFHNLVINKTRIAVCALAILVAFTYNFMQLDTYYIQPYISYTPVVPHRENEISYDDDTGIYTITASEEDFRILHLTDIHIGGSLLSANKDLKALEACYRLIAHTQPDLVIVTGDLTFPMGIISFSLNNYMPILQFCEFMRNMEIPWAFTYGNHDTENMAKSSAIEINELLRYQSFKTSGNLLYPYTQPGCYGRSNQIIEIRNPDGSLNQSLFLIDSNAYTGEGVNVYDYIHDDQVDWYERNINRLCAKEGKDISSMLFFHIPLQEYRTAYELYMQGSSEVKYFFGENGESMIDKVCCSDYPSKLFETAERLGSTKAMFCGHDHYNNLSVEYRGIRLTYGLSIDYLAMPGIERDTDQRGGELITLYPDSGFEVEQIKLTDIS